MPGPLPKMGGSRYCTASCCVGSPRERPARVVSLTELLTEHRDATYRDVLRLPTLSLGLFAAAPGHDDVQSPHGVDGVYVVVAGRAALEVDGVRTPVETGSVVHVPPHVPHRSVDVTHDLRGRRVLRTARTRLTADVVGWACGPTQRGPSRARHRERSTRKASHAADTLRQVVAHRRSFASWLSLPTSACAADCAKR